MRQMTSCSPMPLPENVAGERLLACCPFYIGGDVVFGSRAVEVAAVTGSGGCRGRCGWLYM